MKIDSFSFAAIVIDGATYEHDIVIDGEDDAHGHTPLSTEELHPTRWDLALL